MAQGLGQQHLNKCAHEGCVCTVEPAQTYCSDFCAQASTLKGSSELPGKHLHHGPQCECGHDACEHAHAGAGAQGRTLKGSAAGSGHTTDEAGKEAFRNTGED